MILTYSELLENIENKKIHFDGNVDNIGSNSIDVTLNNTIKTYLPCKIKKIKHNNSVFKQIVIDKKKLKKDFFLRMDQKNKVYEYKIPKKGLILTPGILFLGATNEKAGSDNFIPMYEGRSSTARLGFQSHLSAGFGDIGFKSNWTLEIIVVHPLLIFKNARIGQVYFHQVEQNSIDKLFKAKKEYNSKYNFQTKAQESKMYLDFQKK